MSGRIPMTGLVNPQGKVSFSKAGALAGARQTAPFALGTVAYGLVFGVLARQAGLSTVETLLMSGAVFAGTAQFVALTMWVSPLPGLVIVLTTLVVNMRHLLMGAALQPWFAPLSPLKRYGSAFFITDENWAVTMHRLADAVAKEEDRAFLIGGGLALFPAWVGSTVIGQRLGAAIARPEQWGLDFIFSGVFIVLLVGMWRGKADLLPWLTAALVSVAAARWLPGTWYILLGGLAGSVVGAGRDVAASKAGVDDHRPSLNEAK